MSSKLIALVFEHYPVGGGEMVLALKLADIADDEGRSVKQKMSMLAAATRQSERQVQRQLKGMLGAGFLEVVAHAEGGRGNVTEYSVSKSWVANPGAVGSHGTTSVNNDRDEIGNSVTNEAHIKGDICDIKGDKMSPFNTIKGDICDIKGDKMSPFRRLEFDDENGLIYKALKSIKKLPKRKVEFSLFWDRWPIAKHKKRKQECELYWQKHDFDSEIEHILHHVNHSIIGSDAAMSEGGQFLISPMNFLRSQDWKDSAVTTAKTGSLQTGFVCSVCGVDNVGFKRGGKALCAVHFRIDED